MIGEQEFKHPDWTGSDKLHTFKVFCLDRDTGKVSVGANFIRWPGLRSPPSPRHLRRAHAGHGWQERLCLLRLRRILLLRL